MLSAIKGMAARWAKKARDRRAASLLIFFRSMRTFPGSRKSFNLNGTFRKTHRDPRSAHLAVLQPDAVSEPIQEDGTHDHSPKDDLLQEAVHAG